MNAQSYLMFKLNHSRYGIPATAVQEIFFLPEVTAIAEVPAAILGVINLRGELLPVMDLHQQLNQLRPPLQLTDSMIVLEWQMQRVGIVVSQVDEVQVIPPDQITNNLCGQSVENLQDELMLGIATVENDIVTLLNPERLVQQSLAQTTHLPTHPLPATANSNGNGAAKPFSNLRVKQELYAHLDESARQILQERTIALQCPINAQDSTGLMPLAVVGLAGEYFGFGLEAVYEFTEIHKVTPIPCCPSRIIGNINLRGEIVTLINISDVVDLPMNAVRSRSCSQAVVVRLEQRVAGIAVDDIFDVTYIHPSQMTAAPITMHSTKDDYLQGVAPYQDRMISIINLSKLLTSEVLVVNEEI